LGLGVSPPNDTAATTEQIRNFTSRVVAASAQNSPDVAGGEAAAENFDPVEQHDRDTITVFRCESGIVHVDHLECEASATGPALHHRQCFGADPTYLPSEEANSGHRRSVIVDNPMRPFTVITVILLLLALSIAGVVFVVQLMSTT